MDYVYGYPRWSMEQAENITAADVFPDHPDAEELLDEAIRRGFRLAYPDDCDIDSGSIPGLLRTKDLRECATEYQRLIEELCNNELACYMEAIGSLDECYHAYCQAMVSWAASAAHYYLDQNHPEPEEDPED